MSQTPVLFPGSVLSRNSVMRNSALQAGAYAAMDASLSRMPSTCDEALVTSGANPLTANKARFARLKFKDPASINCSMMFNNHGTIGASSASVGSAIYEYRPQSFGFTLSFLFGAFSNITGPTTVESDFNLPGPVMLDHTKAYVVAVVNSNPSAFTTNCQLHQFSSGPDAYTYAQSINDVTIATGWPSSFTGVFTKSFPAGGDLSLGYRTNLYTGVSNARFDGDQLYGLMY